MGKGKQFLLLLWKNIILLKRSPVRAFFQISMPLFFIIILVLLRAFVIKVENKRSNTYPAFDIDKLPSNVTETKLAFTPNTSDVRNIMDLVAKQLKRLAVVGFQNEKEMQTFLVDNEERNKDGKRIFLGGIVFNNTLYSRNIIYKIRLSSKARKKEKTPFGASPATSWLTQFTFPVFQKPGPRNEGSRYGGPPSYYDEGFLSLQHAVDSAIVKHKGNIQTLNNVTVSVKRFPSPAYIHDEFVLVIQSSLPLLLMLSLIFTALNIVQDIVYEKEKKLKESMKMMGLNGWLHWLAWFTKYFIFLLITMALAAVFFTVKFTDRGRVLNESSRSVIFVFFLLYAISTIMFCFCISVFFSRANIAAAASGILWFLSYIPYFFVQQSYDTMGLGSKLASCLLSNVAMSMGAQLIGKFEGEGTGVQWSNINHGPSIDDDLTLGYVFGMFVVDSIVYGLIAWYVEAVFPGNYGVPQPWYFPVLASYWCGKNKEVEVGDFHNLQNGTCHATTAPEYIEKDPVGLEPGVEIRNLKKVFSTEKGVKTAVNGVSLNLYEGQITVLLGHNGAGKTTLMSMLTGLFPATSGSALVNGCSIRDNISGVRSSLGLCPQHDVLFDRLTVEEHLWFFAKLKSCSSSQAKGEVDRMIECIGLTDKRQTQARALSGGMKRKLSVGIALIGGSKVVMLDEPTSGMDPSARRFTWDLLQQHKEGRTILLTTHFMDEADILGDRIAIMAEGNVKCCGSSLFLKNKYGVGYHMVIVKEPSCDVPKVTGVVASHVPTATVESNIGAELSFILPSEATGNFENLFLELETRRKELGIASYGASVTTMEEVFLKVGEEMDSSLSDKLQQTSKGTPSANGVLESTALPVPSEKSSVLARMGTFGTSSASYGTFGDYNNYNHTSGFRLFRQRWYAMFVKRLLHSKRHKLAIISQLLLPLVYTLFALISAKTIPQPTDSPPLALSTLNFLNNDVPYYCVNSTCNLADNYTTQWPGGSKTKPVNVKVDMGQYLLDEPKKIGVGPFNKRDLIAATFKKQEDKVNVTAWFNNQAYHSIAVSLAAADNAILRATLGSNYSLMTVNHPLPRTAKESANDLQRNGLGFNVAINILFGMAFLASSFVVFLVQERSNKAKHVQFVSGVDPFSYWDSAYTWDLINFLLPTLSIMILVAAFDVPAYTGLNLLDVADALKWVFLVLPNYCLGQGISDIFNNYNALYYVDQFCRSYAKFLPLAKCEKMAKELIGSELQFQTNYLAWDNPGIGRYLLFLALEGIVFYSLVLLIEYGALGACARFFRRIRNPFAFVNVSEDSHLADDDDVLEEKERVLRCTDKDDVLVIKELTKVFCGNGRRSPLVAVDSLSLGVPMNECFGLLGINGAGKTTTFRMLTGDETMTSGTALVEGFDIRTNMNKVRQRIGYCPQFDALIDQMTGREILYMYARLRGVPEVMIPDVVDNLIQSLLLGDHADKLAGSYSGGNKRKLSTAISLVGDPPVVFLDEPTTGMDPVARRLLWDALSRVRADGRCIVITSHSMEECEALCTRLAIMVNGRFKCLGSPQHLKTKFGEGYTLLARVASGTSDTGPLKQFIEGTFPGSVLKDEHQGMIHYHIRDTNVSWAQLFGTIERIKLNYNIEDYSVSQTTLEQVFLNFARGQRAEDE
ncbi:ATP-binding cassette sub-family A member 3 [Stylophora pistillata]|uniref:ATP-binding cassette sub-family A member 3 n=1 Tax=Stylophora pistillata TaxID=50429 RepID=A0A2B4RLT4_STYPI|nr:ATP-binding cassette sub-family A member 3 [Stylophora pistillata]